IREQLELGDVQIVTAGDGPAALRALRETRFDCLVLSPETPDLSPAALAEEMEELEHVETLPVILYGHGSQADGAHPAWKSLGAGCTLRRAHSPERLIDQAALSLHREVNRLPEARREMLENLHRSENVLPGKKVLIVDDDMRNIFALSSVLEEHDMV